MKKMIMSTALLLLGLSLSAQQQIKSVNSTFKPGWTVGANAGIDMILGEGNNFFNPNKPFVSPFTNNYSYLGRLAAGYKFTPVLGLRGMLGFYHYNWLTVPVNSAANKFGTEQLTADLMLNLSNWSLGYNPDRKIDFSLFVGAGAAFVNQNVTESPLAGIFRGGLQSDYHLNPLLDLNLILEANLATDNFNDVSFAPLPVDIIPALSVGITYHIPEYVKKETPQAKPAIQPEVEKPVVTPVTPPAVQPSAIASTENKPTVTPEVKVNPTVTPVVAPVVAPVVVPTITPEVLLSSALNEKIFFSLGKSVIANTLQEESITKIVNFMKQHPEATVTVSGYADKSTGITEFNNYMSKQRAVNVANTLIRNYGISIKRINVKWFGSGVQPYLQAAKNRLVIVKSPLNYTTTNVTKVPTVKTAVNKVDTLKAEETDLLVVVNFTDNKAEISDPRQENEIMKAALYLRRNPTARITVSGYADKTASSTDINNELSKKRALIVANTLIKKYSIKYERIETKWYGNTKQKYAKPSMNRLVLIENIK